MDTEHQHSQIAWNIDKLLIEVFCPPEFHIISISPEKP